ncbi:TIGR03085 family metal-binding protein [Raineyella antarctica]|nr:TIGR03085 family metal-binding protein [Raineyella antarctica]
MDTSTLAQRERHAMADLMLEVGPDAPTLCKGWTAYDLAAHLWVREADPVGAVGIAVPPLAGVTEARIAKAKKQHPFAELVGMVRSGPPKVSWARPMDAVANTLEYLVHHEDVRRGADASIAAREMSAEDDAEIMDRLRQVAMLQLGRRGVRTVLVDAKTGRKVEAGQGGVVTVTGTPTELALYAFGREAAAHVEVLGPLAPAGPDD